MNKKKQFNPELYTNQYYKRHFEQYRLWENGIGKDIVKRFALKSIVDFGCGVGSILEGAFSAGCKDLLGIEISFAEAKQYFVKIIESHIIYGDVTNDLHLNRKFDCCTSFEVAEHLSPFSSSNFVNNLTKYSDKYIIFTAAPPGQPGTGHINCRDKHFWVEKIENKGFRFQEHMINEIQIAWKIFDAPDYVLRNLMVFQKEKI